MADSSPNQGFLLRAQFVLVIFGGLYVALVGLLAIPFFQTQFPVINSTVYLNAVRLPLFANFDTPEKYGLAPNKTLNLKIQTSDNESLGAWFILSDPYYHSLPSIPTALEEHVSLAVQQNPTILFFHGNAATRAFKARIQHYGGFTSRLGANVLAIDYRGFADSTGTPSEAGLTRDARAAWDWLVTQGTKEEDILIIGHSLGTGVASQLGAQLAKDDIKPRGIVLLSPFSSIRELLNTYNIFGVLPIIKPIAIIPYAPTLLTMALIHKFDTLSAVPDINANVLVAHAENDWDIPYTHSDVIFNAFLDPFLPPLTVPSNPMSLSSEEWESFTTQQAARAMKRRDIITSKNIQHFGTMDEFVAGGRKVVLLKTLAGGHDYLGVQEGVQDVIGKTFGLL